MIRPVRLAQIAAQAEATRLRGMVTRIAVRAAFGVVALVFVIGALVFAHIAAWSAIVAYLHQSDLITAGILGGADLLIAIILGILASRSAPSRIEQEALAVRRQAMDSMSNTLSLTQLALPLLRFVPVVTRRRRK